MADLEFVSGAANFSNGLAPMADFNLFSSEFRSLSGAVTAGCNFDLFSGSADVDSLTSSSGASSTFLFLVVVLFKTVPEAPLLSSKGLTVGPFWKCFGRFLDFGSLLGQLG